MGNNNSSKSSKKGKKSPYSLSIELFGDKFMAGSQISGHAVLILDDEYESPTGLDKAVLSFKGFEGKRCVEQKGKS